MQTPASTARTCPYCQTRCPAHATICYACKRVMAAYRSGPMAVPPRELTDEDLDQLRNALARLTAQAEAPPLRIEAPNRLRPATVAFVAGWVVTAGLALVAAEPAPIAVIAAVLFVVAAVKLTSDLRQPPASDGLAPERVVRGYYRGCGTRLWRSAYYFLSPIGRQLRVTPPGQQDHGVPAEQVVRASPDLLARYWRLVDRRPRFQFLTRLAVEPIDTEGSVRRYRVTMGRGSIPWWIFPLLVFAFLIGVVVYFAMREDHTRQFDVIAYRYRSRWWVLTGELGSPTDTTEGIAAIHEEAQRLANDGIATPAVALRRVS